MKYKILIFVSIIFLGIGIYSFYSSTNLDRDVSEATLAMHYGERGNIKEVEKILNKIRLPKNIEIANTALILAKKISDKNFQIPENINYDKNLLRYSILKMDLKDANKSLSILESRSDFFNDKRYAAVIYANIAKRYYESGDKNSYINLMNKSLSAIKEAGYFISRVQIAEILDIIVSIEEPEFFIKFMNNSLWSRDWVLSIYSGAGSDKLTKSVIDYKKKYGKVIKDRIEICRLDAFINANKNCKSNNKATFEKGTLYIGIEFNMSWSIKNWRHYRFPLLAYLSYRCNNMDMYEHYKKLSLSNTQLENMKAGYFEYVVMASNVFARTGDFKESIDLIKTLKTQRYIQLALRTNLKQILKNEGAAELLLKERML